MVAYEILLMLDPDLPEGRQEEIIKRARELVEKANGTWVRHDAWGRRRLAYEINHKGEGSYHLLNFDADAETLAELSRILRITDGVMRHLAVRRVEGSAPGPPLPFLSGCLPAAPRARLRSPTVPLLALADCPSGSTPGPPGRRA